MHQPIAVTAAFALALIHVAIASDTTIPSSKDEKSVVTSTPQSVLDFALPDIDGKEVGLSDYKGKVILIVNVASKCGFTPQYKELEAVYKKYQDSGLVILAFPANNFMSQEPGQEAEIKSFCSLTYGVTFPMFSKISVAGKEIHPLYKFLTDKTTNPEFGGKITWNFNKFLIDRNGNIVDRFDSKTKPDDAKVIRKIEKLLAEKR